LETTFVQISASGPPQIRVAGFQKQIRRAGVKIIRADGVTLRLGLPAEGNAILIVTFAVLDQIAHGKKSFREREITRFARGAIQFHDAHVMRRTNILQREFRRRLLENVVQTVRRPAGDGEKIGLAGDAIMDARGRQQLA
jgi:hypothetical protein